MRRRLRRRNERGWTLIELMVVMAILVMLAAVITTQVVKRVEDAKVAVAHADIQSMETALDLYHVHNGTYPSSQQGLQALVEKPTSEPEAKNWDGPYLKKGVVPTDPWDRGYVYTEPGEHNTDSFDLYSLGRDGVEGGEGKDADIVNWDTSQR